MTAQKVKQALAKLADKSRIPDYQRFFKTGPGEYGQGDVFIGVKVPNQRKVSRQYKDLPLTEIKKLLNSKIHEHRLTALFIMVLQFKKSKIEVDKKKLVDLYLDNRSGVNNWDLVDSSAPYFLGEYYYDHDRKPMYEMARSKNLWDRRMAVMASFYWLRQKGDFADTFKMAEWLLNDKEDLIHKAVGWMLREIGNADRNAERLWLDKHYQKMPRTMLRYAIEKFPENERQRYLSRTKTVLK